jgi:hypothetical protein
MCEKWNESGPCRDYECPHNLFWEGLRLNRNRIQETAKALAINNCCCLIHKPWTVQEIEEAWGLPKTTIMRSEKVAESKLQRVVTSPARSPYAGLR